LQQYGDVHAFVKQTYKWGKALAATEEGSELLTMSLPGGASINELGVISEPEPDDRASAVNQFVSALGRRHWGRRSLDNV
jgi:hypothetical protein